MLRKGPFIFLVLAMLLAGFAAWGAHRWIAAQAARAAASQVHTSPVVVATAELPAGQKLEPKDLSVQNWPAEALPPGHFGVPSQVAGRVLRGPVVKGEVILSNKLAREGLAGGLSSVVPAGFRAMTVRVDEVVGVAGFVQPGDRVDVLVTMAKGSFSQDPGTKVVLQDVLVLTVGEKVQEENEGGKPRQRKVSVVTLQVTPEEGERLGLATLEGRVLLALRNQGDHEAAATRGIQMNALLPMAAPPVVAKPAPPEGPSVEVIKVASRNVQSLVPKAEASKGEAKAAAGAPQAPALPQMPIPASVPNIPRR